MAVQYYVHYSESTGAILGLYNDGRHAKIPEPNLAVDENTRNSLLKSGDSYVQNGEIVKSFDIQRTKDRPNAASAYDEQVKCGVVYDDKCFCIDDASFINMMSYHALQEGGELLCYDGQKYSVEQLDQHDLQKVLVLAQKQRAKALQAFVEQRNAEREVASISRGEKS